MKEKNRKQILLSSLKRSWMYIKQSKQEGSTVLLQSKLKYKALKECGSQAENEKQLFDYPGQLQS